MPETSARERDLVLAPNEYAYVSDQTKGKIDIYVGPHKASLSQTDQAVVFNNDTKKFDKTYSLEEAIKLFSTAPEGWYLILKNPATDGSQPPMGVGSLPSLDVGRKVNVPGPVSYPLWPGQMVKVIQGHHLRSNQYILARVYDEDAARENWDQAVIKTAEGDEGRDKKLTASDLTMGKLIVIKGTEVSFYIPPTGIEVVSDESGNLIRNAETLERLEYSILKDEDGNKRYVRGPEVVFPEPTEMFIEKKGSRKFKAIELNENSGLYIKVIADYNDDDNEVQKDAKFDHEVGDELFMTGNEQMIYFPREEHAIIKYGNQDIHYGIAIPAGEARYVLNRLTGEISIKEGPDVFLPDPRKEVNIRRMLDPKLVELWFPGNKEALSYNSDLQEMIAKYSDESMGFLPDNTYYTAQASGSFTDGSVSHSLSKKMSSKAVEDLMGDDFERKQTYTPPRTITLDTKYEGTIDIDIWTGYAVLVVSKTGNRRVVVGPDTIHLAYDESLEAFELSTGNPKNNDDLIKDVYLRVLNNKVSDTITAMTKDLCEVDIKVSYRVNFEGDEDNWFNVENYVKFLTDHLRSVVRSVVKMHGIEEFYANSIEIIRDFVLGKHSEDGRSGKFFPENGMRVTDVEVLSITIGDDDIEDLLMDNQFDIVKQTLAIASKDRQLELATKDEENKQAVDNIMHETRTNSLALKKEEAEKAAETLEADKTKREKDQAIKNMEHDADLNRTRRENANEMQNKRIKQALEAKTRKEETKAVVDKTNAVSPQLIEAMTTLGDKAVLEKISESFNIMSIIGGKSLTDVANNLLKGTKLEGIANTVKKKLSK